MLIKEDGYNYKERFKTSSKFLIANGYYGYRGSLSEDTSKDMVVWNLNGVYDQVDNQWRESVNAFNPLFTFIKYHNETLHPAITQTKKHNLSLDLTTGILNRKTTFIIDDCEIIVRSRRFANQKNLHLIHEEYQLSTNKPLNIELYQGIDMNVFDISGRHIKKIKQQIIDGVFFVSGITQEKEHPIDVMSKIETNFESTDKPELTENKLLHHYSIKTIPNQTYRIIITAGVIHSKQHQKDILHKMILNSNFSSVINENNYFWKEKWNKAKIHIKGNQEANLAINYDIFQLISHRPYNEFVSIPARGLSGQVYKGAVFWDTEIYMFLFYLLNDIHSAKNLIKYRIHGLPETKIKANHYHYDGAFYAWESQEFGFDACSDYNLTNPITNEPVRTYFKELQIHINGAIVYALNQYLTLSKDYSILKSGGLEMLIEINKFYASFLTKNKKNKYECINVIGPDEYHEHINNNAYTNYLIKFCMTTMINYFEYFKKSNLSYYHEISRKYKNIINKAKDIEKNIFLPKPNKDGIISQFDGYLTLKDIAIEDLLAKKKTENEYLGGKDGLASQTQIIKQADVVLLLVLFPNLFSKEIQKANYHYYKKRTEHGSSLSKAIYSILASRLNEVDEAYDYFINGASIDLTGKSKQYAGGIYIGGNHLAAYGGAYMAVILGFLGLDFNNKTFNKNIPKAFEDINTKLLYEEAIL
ncbi:MAG: glycoside hydrolase family 65 protein [Candidatus Izimaplasma sp.]|nr:glycoside hydrolase family 65 protein [Candidatus Izimaplasma bacterium]